MSLYATIEKCCGYLNLKSFFKLKKLLLCKNLSLCEICLWIFKGMANGNFNLSELIGITVSLFFPKLA